MEYQKLLKKKEKAIKTKNEDLLCEACADMADYYMKEEKFEEAIKEYDILVRVYKKRKEMINLATIYRGMGEASMSLTNFQKAIDYHKIYLTLTKKHDDKVEEQRALATLGHTYLTKYLAFKDNRNDLFEAQMFTNKSLKVCESLTNVKKFDLVDMTARIYNNLGLIEEHLGRHDKSIDLFKRAIAMCIEHCVYPALYQAYNSLASLYEKRGEYKKAIENFNLAIETAKKMSGKWNEIGECYILKANILIKLDESHAAKKNLQKAYQLKLSSTLKEEVEKKLKTVVKLYRTEKELISNTCSPVDTAKCYDKIGDCFCSLGYFDKAIEYYLKLLEATKRTGGNLKSCFYSLAATYRDDGQFEKAIEYFEKEYELCEFKKGLDTLCEIADTKESAGKSSDEVIAVYERAIQRCRNESNPKEEKRILNRILKYLDKTNNSIVKSFYEKRLQEINCPFSDSEHDELGGDDVSDDDDVSLGNLTEVSLDSDLESPSGKRRSRNYAVKKNLRGETTLHTACINGNTQVVKVLLENGHPVNYRDNAGWLPLHDACLNGHYDVVELLLDKGAAICDRGGAECSGVTPLHDAAANGHLEIMELLINRGASVLAKTDEGETPYHYLMKVRSESEMDDERKKKCDDLLARMGAILEKTGQSKAVNWNIGNSAFVQGRQSKYTRSTKRQLVTRMSSDSGDSSESSGDEKNSKQGRKTKATEEYKLAMDSLRTRRSDPLPSTSTGKRSIYVAANDDVGDEWLEDDLAHSNTAKKRKISTTNTFMNSLGTRSYKSVSPKKKSPSKTPEKQRILEIQSEDEFEKSPWRQPRSQRSSTQLDCFQINVKSVPLSDQTSPKKKGRPPKKNTLQPKITRFGSCVSPKKTQLKSPMKSSVLSLMNEDPMLAMDVDVEGRPFRVTTRMSLRNDLTVKWLAEETASRYAKKEYVTPVLELKTTTGAELADDDPIATLFVTDSQVVEVKARVLRWITAPISQRYIEACTDMNTVPIDVAIRKLQGVTISLDLKNCGLDAASIAPLCKALSRENRLSTLDLSNNYLSTDCVKLLVKSLPTLDCLNKLILRSTNLTSEHLKIFSDMLEQSNYTVLTKLQSLDLSDNFLSDACIDALETILDYLKLKQLDLSLLNFTSNIFFVKLNLDKIEYLNLSGNKLNNDSLIQFLSFTNWERLISLDVSYNNTSSNFLMSLINLFKPNPIKFQYLNVAGCSVEDTEVFELLRSSDDLESLILSYNNVTSLTVRRIIESTIIKGCHLLGCKDIDKYFDDCVYWRIENYFSKQKTIVISCSDRMATMLTNLWENKYPQKVCVERTNRVLRLKEYKS